MTDFEKWYNFNRPSFPNTRNQFIDVLRQAYEAGAASQAVTLRDKFAGQAMAGLYSDSELEMSDYNIATFSYDMADAMLEARKVPAKGQQ
jgi:hypothetical protein